MFKKLTLQWNFVLTDMVLFSVLYWLTIFLKPVTSLILSGEALLFIMAFAFRIFFLMLLLETGSVFVISMKRFVSAFTSYCILFAAGYLILFSVSMQLFFSPIGWEHCFMKLQASLANSYLIYPYLIATGIFLYRFRN